MTTGQSIHICIPLDLLWTLYFTCNVLPSIKLSDKSFWWQMIYLVHSIQAVSQYERSCYDLISLIPKSISWWSTLRGQEKGHEKKCPLLFFKFCILNIQVLWHKNVGEDIICRIIGTNIIHCFSTVIFPIHQTG